MSRHNAVLLAMAAAGVVTVALLIGLASSTNNQQPSERIDELSGSFRGIQIGDPVARLNALEGECTDTDSWAPCGKDAADVSQPHTLPGGWDVRSFPDVAFLTGLTGIKGFVVTTATAKTRRGIQVGDRLSKAEAAYPGSSCDVVHYEDSDGPPYCVSHLPGGPAVTFGGDPIDSIVVEHDFDRPRKPACPSGADLPAWLTEGC